MSKVKPAKAAYRRLHIFLIKKLYRKHEVGSGMQAGVAMGLAKTVAVRFPEWGPEFATLMVRCLLLCCDPVHLTVCSVTCVQWTRCLAL